MTATRSVSVLLLLAATAAAAPAKEVPPCPRVRIVFEDGEPGDPGYRFEVAALSKDAKIEVVRPGGDVAVPYVWMRDPYADRTSRPCRGRASGTSCPPMGSGRASSARRVPSIACPSNPTRPTAFRASCDRGHPFRRR